MTAPLTVWVGWTAQRPLNAAIAVSLAAAFVAVVLAISDRPSRRRRAIGRARGTTVGDGAVRRTGAAASSPRSRWVVLAGLFVDSGWAWWGLAGGAAVVATRRIRLAGLVAVAAIGWIAVGRRHHGPPGPPTGDAGLPAAVRGPPPPRPVRRRRRRRQRPRPPPQASSSHSIAVGVRDRSHCQATARPPRVHRCPTASPDAGPSRHRPRPSYALTAPGLPTGWRAT